MTAIYWPAFCLNRTEYDAFWSDAISLNTNQPDLTHCFQQTVLVFSVYGPFLFLGFLYLIKLNNTPSVKNGYRRRWFNWFKTAWITAGLALMTIVCVWDIWKESQPGIEWMSLADYSAYTFKAFALALAMALNTCEFSKGIVTSATFLFYLFAAMMEGVVLYSYALRWNNQDYFVGLHNYVCQAMYFTVMLVLLICNFKSDLNALPGGPEQAKGGRRKDELTPLLAKPATEADMTSSSGGFSKSSANTHEEMPSKGPDPCPANTAPFWNTAVFSWIFRYVIQGFKKSLVFEDLPDIMPADNSEALLPTFFENYYTGDAKRGEPRPHRHLGSALFRSVWHLMAMSAVFRLFSMGLSLLGPQILGWLIAFLETDREYLWQGIVLASFLFITNCITSLFTNQLLYVSFRVGMRTRSVVNCVVYRKALCLSSTARRETTTGNIVSLMSVDAQKVQDACQSSVILWSAPFVIVFSIVLLWNTVGISALAGILVLVLVFPVNAFYLARKTAKLQMSGMRYKDQRFRVLGEILSGIKVLKFYAWEMSFLNKVTGYRNNELEKIRITNYINAFSAVMWFLTPYLVTLAVFAAYSLTSDNYSIDAETAFVALTYINMLNVPISILPFGIFSLAQGIVSLRRLQKFLDLEELGENTTVFGSSTNDTAVKMEDGSYSWAKGDQPFLRNINLDIPRGSLVAIVGQVGCGKSALINSLLGELVQISGRAEANGSIAYIPQQAWILNTTLKSNILFQKEFLPERYDSICDACALTPDLAILPGGDMTEIGEKGINLSGGQKQRVSLARAVYQNEDIYLLDDPLSAVDAHVGKHIFEKVLGPDGLLKYKTRILVTHGATYLPYVDYIYTMKDGRISEAGRFNDLVANNGEFAEFLRNYVAEMEPESDDHAAELMVLIDRISEGESQSEMSDTGDQSLIKSIKEKRTRLKSLSGSYRRRHSSSVRSERSEEKPKAKSPLDKAKLIEAETSQTGKLQMKVIGAYMKAAGLLCSLFVSLGMVGLISFQTFTSIWLSSWTAEVPTDDLAGNREATVYRLTVYGTLGVLQLVCAMAASFALAHGCYQASQGFHSHLLQRILHAPMAFFDTTPLGRIMNRFSKDLDVIDMNVPMSMRMWLTSLAPVAMTFFLMVYAYRIFIFLAIPILIGFFLLKTAYMNMGRQVKRIDSVRRSPIYSQFDESVAGATSIRAFKLENVFTEKCDRLINESQRPWFMLFTSYRWFGVNMEFLSSMIILITGVYAVLDDTIEASLAGLTLSYALTISMYMNQLIRQSTELETHIVSVERLQEYADLENEADWIIPGHRPPRNWPSEGNVQFQSYSTRYRAGLELVLRNICFNIKGGEKVGIVGRTGAGKSSLSLGLYRIIEAASGKVNIDGVDVGEIGLHDLRSKIGIIPQDPVIFSGTLRSNLDPFDTYTDSELWDALKYAHLLDFVKSQPAGLNYECGENGDSLSVGQRQLVCLGRALLRNSKILVLDEATAAVDLETDALIQCTIRSQFENCTILTVAHRISTVMDYDKIMVFDKGEILEMDSPTALLRDKRTIFSKMARDAGLI